MPIVALFGLLFGMSSCGSYQYVGADNDGIYGEAEPNVQYEDAVVEVPNRNNSDYYKNYFRSKSLEAEQIPSEEEIFTDIDSYESGNYDLNDAQGNDYIGYAGWGEDTNGVTINYINNGWNNWGWNGGFGWGWNNWRWNRWNNWGWNNWGYYDPFWGPGWGWNNWGWNAGWGWNTWGWNSWAWNSPYYGYPYYGYNNYRPRTMAYSSTRRGSYSGRTTTSGTSSLSRRSSISNRSARTNTATSKYYDSRRNSVAATTANRRSYSSDGGTVRRGYDYNSSRTYNPGTSRSSGVMRRSTSVSPSSNSASRSSSSTMRRSSSNVYRSSPSYNNSRSSNTIYNRRSSSPSNNRTYSSGSSRSSSPGSYSRSGGSSSRGSAPSRSSSSGGRRR